MAKSEAIFFDFFGTLVDYSPSRTEQGYYKSHELMVSMGANMTYDEFIKEWSDESAAFDRQSDIDDSEYSMEVVSRSFLTRIVGRQPSDEEITKLAKSYVDEWNTGVVYPSHTKKVVEHLANRYRLAVVTNTHQFDLVPNHLTSMGIAHFFETVVTSVEVGWRKPHPIIYGETLSRLGILPNEAIFVGDNYAADFVGPKINGMTAFLLNSTPLKNVPESQRLNSLPDLLERDL